MPNAIPLTTVIPLTLTPRAELAGHVGAIERRSSGPDDRHRIGLRQLEKAIHPAGHVQHRRRAEQPPQPCRIVRITGADQRQLRSVGSSPRGLGFCGAEGRIFPADLILSTFPLRDLQPEVDQRPVFEAEDLVDAPALVLEIAADALDEPGAPQACRHRPPSLCRRRLGSAQPLPKGERLMYVRDRRSAPAPRGRRPSARRGSPDAGRAPRAGRSGMRRRASPAPRHPASRASG